MTGTLRELDDSSVAWLDNEAQVEFYGQEFSAPVVQSRLLARQIRGRLVSSWRWMLESRRREALELADAVASQLHELEPAAATRYRTQVQLIRAFGKALSDDAAGMLLELSGAPDPRHNHLTRALLRFGYWRLSRWSELYALPVACPATSPRDAFACILDLAILAAAALERMQLITASRFAADAISMADAAGLGDSIAAASAAAVLASVRYELGYLDDAEQLLLGRLPIISAQGTPDVIIRAYSLLSRIAQHRGQWEHAAGVLNEGQSLGERTSRARIVLAMMAERVRMLVARRYASRARQEMSTMQHYAQTHPVASHLSDEVALLCTLANLQVVTAEGLLADAVGSLRSLLGAAPTAQRQYTAFRLTLELAGTLAEGGEEEPACRLLVRALKRGERAGLLQCWIDAGRSCSSLLERVAQRLPHAASLQLSALDAYLRTILAHQTMRKSAHQRIGRHSVRASEHLSARERAVLVLISKGQSNKRVAQTLKVTPETVKSHLKRAFVKLGASTRAEAVSRAADLGQLIGVVIPVVAEREHLHLVAPNCGQRRCLS
jgi:LuxR family maltose regulon positive regulatory protein